MEENSAKGNIEALAEILRNSGRIVFFTGAGVSTESGIPDFRSADGIYNQKIGRTVSPEEMISHSYYVRYPAEFFDFYKEKLIYPDASPNAAHRAMAALEKMDKVRGVVTQNIDGLHQKAGSEKVYELHGSVLRNYCEKCGKFFGVETVLETPEHGVPACSCGGRIKPDVVLYEEALDDRVVSGAVRAITEADTLVIGGTSLVVYPAAGLIRYFRGKKLVLINQSVTQADSEADLIVRGKIGEVMKEVMTLLNS